MLSYFSATQKQRRFNFSPQPKESQKVPQRNQDYALNSRFILDMMKENDTLTIKRAVPPHAYFEILLKH